MLPNGYDFCSEFYIVEKSIEVVVQIREVDRTFRIDALHNPTTNRYRTRASVLEQITVQPIYPQRKTELVRAWIEYNIPWTNKESADDALVQALGFLKEQSA